MPVTDWSQIYQLKEASPSEQEPLLDILARKYWTPIFQFLVCRGYSEHDAQDLIQEFFAFALRTNLFAKAKKRKGRFRSFLLGCLNNFVANESRKQSTRKRKPAEGLASIDELAEEGCVQPKALVDPDTPELQFHRAWVQEVVRNVLEALEKDCARTGKTTHFKLFQMQVVLPELEGERPPPLQQQAGELGLKYKEAANQILTAKRAFRRLLEKEVRAYACSEEDGVNEQRDVLSLMRLEGSA